MSDVRPGYKRTEVGLIPDEWEVATLSDVATADWGNTAKTKASYRLSGYQAFSATGPDGFVDWFEHDGQGIVISAIGAQCGKSWLASGKWTPIKNTIWIETRPSSCVAEFLYRVTSDADFWPKSGQAQPFISVGSVRKARFPVPPLPEQKAITEALGDADALIGALEALIAKKRDIKQGAMQELLTGQRRLPGFQGEWKTPRLVDLASADGDNLGSGTPSNYAFRYISLEDVDVGVLTSYSEQRFASAPSRARRRLAPGDVLVSTVRPNLKSHLLFDKRGGDWVCSTGFSVVRATKGVLDPKFLFQVLFSTGIETQIEMLLVGSNYPAINSKDVKGLQIPGPSFDEQRAIAAALCDMDTEIAAQEAKLGKSKAVKQGMMQVLLTGEARLV